MFNKRSKKMCPYCGGLHPAEQCPLFMMPPMGDIYGGMPGGMHGGMPGGMHGGMPGGMHGGMPGGHGGDMMMPGMHEMMEHHTRMLEHIAHRVDQIYDIVASMHMGGAKG